MLDQITFIFPANDQPFSDAPNILSLSIRVWEADLDSCNLDFSCIQKDILARQQYLLLVFHFLLHHVVSPLLHATMICFFWESRSMLYVWHVVFGCEWHIDQPLCFFISLLFSVCQFGSRCFAMLFPPMSVSACVLRTFGTNVIWQAIELFYGSFPYQESLWDVSATWL